MWSIVILVESLNLRGPGPSTQEEATVEMSFSLAHNVWPCNALHEGEGAGGQIVSGCSGTAKSVCLPKVGPLEG